MREVLVFERKWHGPASVWLDKPVGTGEFIQYSSDYEELQNGVGIFPVAIVEMEDGSVKSVMVDMIRFLKPETSIKKE